MLLICHVNGSAVVCHDIPEDRPGVLEQVARPSRLVNELTHLVDQVGFAFKTNTS